VWVVKSEWKELKQAFIMSNESDAEKLCKILNRQPSLEDLYQIAEILQVSAKDLLIDKTELK
jgi:hypothetical protein